ncbi:MAG: DUF1552 domain-containing protein [Zavarzinella sp.]
MTTRREFFPLAAGGMGAFFLGAPFVQANPAGKKPPMRFIFMHRGNGLFPRVVVPPTLSKADMEREARKEALDIDLDRHDLPEWMACLTKHKSDLTLLQGLSGKMCTTGHHSWCSSLGVYKANERISSIKWATVDFELAKLFPSPMEHIELACFPLGGGNPRGSLNGIAKGFSARGPQQPNYAFGSPKIALQELFKSVSDNKNLQMQTQLAKQLLEFTHGNEAPLVQTLKGHEQAKVSSYADSIEAIRERDRKIDLMAEQIRKHIPKLDAKYLAEEMTTIDRQRGHAEVLLGALISGLTNVVSFTIDELGHDYTGIPGIENEKVNMHDVGHGKSFGGLDAEEIRNRARTHHMTLVDTIVSRLKAVPEGDGTMFDNTMVMYFPNSGETHHSLGWEYPFVVLSGKNTPLKIQRRYIRLPNYDQPGHKTLGNWYTTILNAYGNPIKHFGDFDPGIARYQPNQAGPIEQFLA